MPGKCVHISETKGYHQKKSHRLSKDPNSGIFLCVIPSCSKIRTSAKAHFRNEERDNIGAIGHGRLRYMMTTSFTKNPGLWSSIAFFDGKKVFETDMGQDLPWVSLIWLRYYGETSVGSLINLIIYYPGTYCC